MDLDFATASELTQALREKTVSSRELLDHLQRRIERHNPRLNAIVALDLDRARVAAAAADQATARGRASEPGDPGGAGGAGRGEPPLHGLPMTIKDVWETEGLVTTSGAPGLAQHVPGSDALAVARLKAAGAIVIGKTNTPLYAGDVQTFNDVYGVTNNPWDPARTAGGSSGGAAAALAAGLTPLELGSDIGGSIRNPAHYNGVYGLKPSWGVVPTRGHIPGPPGSLVEADVGVGGPLARSVADLELALGVIAGPVPEDAPGWRLDLDAGPPVGDVAGLRVATVFGAGDELVPLAGDVRTVLEAFAGRLADAGALVQPVPLPVPLADGLRTWAQLVLPIIGAGLPDHEYQEFLQLAAAVGPEPDNGGPGAGNQAAGADDLLLLAARSFVSRYRTWMSAHAVRQHQRAAWAELLERFDVVLAPVMPTAAFPHDLTPMTDRRQDIDGVFVPALVTLAWCGAIGSVLLPVVTLPAGLTPVGQTRGALPVGIQVIGRYLGDLRLLRIAGLIDQAAGPGFTAPPGSR
jgi:amidase